MNDTPLTIRCTASGTLSVSDFADSLSGTMDQTGSCYYNGFPIENTQSASFSGGSADDVSISFSLEDCHYTGVLNDSGTSIEGSVSCPTTLNDGSTMLLKGRWLAVR